MVITGAGECGVRAAITLREQGYLGAITLIGEESSLPYERLPLSKGLNEAPKPIRSEASYLEADIDCRLGTCVRRILPSKRAVHLADDTCLKYDKLLLVTGACARLFPGKDGCATLRSDRDAAAIRGAIVPNAKIGIITDAVVAHADGQSVALKDGTVLTFDRVIAGVGAVPKTELAADAGLSAANGIVVVAGCRTSDPDIYAAGDCCNFEWQGERVRLESWKAAQDQGAHAARAMLGTDEPYTAVSWFWSDQYDVTLQVAGLFDPDRIVHRRELADDTRIVFQCDEHDRLVAAAGIGPGNAVSKDIRILEKLIERGAAMDTVVLSDPSKNLKRLLKAA